MEHLVGSEVRRFDAQQIFHGAGDVVTFHDLGRAGDPTLERLLTGLGVAVAALCFIIMCLAVVTLAVCLKCSRFKVLKLRCVHDH